MIQIQIFKRFNPQSSNDAQITEYWIIKEINFPVLLRLQSDCEINNIYLLLQIEN